MNVENLEKNTGLTEYEHGIYEEFQAMSKAMVCLYKRLNASKMLPKPVDTNIKIDGFNVRISSREVEVLQGLVDYHGDYSKMAEKLIIAESTLKSHLTSIFQKLNVGSKLAAVIESYRLGLIHL